MKSKLFIFLCLVSSLQVFSQGADTIYLWPGAVPGETEAKSAAVFSGNDNGGVARISSVTDPAIVVFHPKAGKGNGAAVVICPGGGYNILAIDLEGYEIASWLNSLGYTAFVLQYRVPRKQEGALQDVQRALRLVRANAGKWNVEPGKIGVLGFSAGGSLSARAETRYSDQTYPPVDNADKLSCRPDFAVLIYPAYLDQGKDRSVTPELKVTSDTPPTFIFATTDDKYSNSALVFAGALRDAQVSVELHLMPVGGHGYGLRTGNPAAEKWPGWAASWMATILKPE